MKAGLAKHAEVRLCLKISQSTDKPCSPVFSSHFQKLKDTIPEVKQATDRESRGEASHRGGIRGRGRGGGFAARGFAAAGLTKGLGHPHRGNGDAEGVKRGDGA
jgi:hypothetical protein